MYKNSKRTGMALSLVVVVLGVTGIAMALTAAQIGLSRAAAQNYAQQDFATRAALYGCQDETNAQLRRNANFSAATISNGSGVCTLAIQANGTTRSITLTQTTGTTTKSLTYTIDTTTFAISNQSER